MVPAAAFLVTRNNFHQKRLGSKTKMKLDFKRIFGNPLPKCLFNRVS